MTNKYFTKENVLAVCDMYDRILNQPHFPDKLKLGLMRKATKDLRQMAETRLISRGKP